MHVRCLNCEYPSTETISLPASSMVPRLLRVDMFPFLVDEASIRNTLLAIHSDIAQLDYEIARLQAALQKVSAKREAFRKLASEHESLISPIRRLPPELLAEIFMYRLPTGLTPTRDGNYNIMVLSHVCKQWRDVALSTPILWSALSIWDINSQNCQSKVSLVRTWLTRLRNYPLSYSLSCFRGVETTKLMTDMVLPRCRNAELRVVFLPPRLGPLPHLKSLNILSGLRNFYCFTRESPLILESAAMLQDVRLAGITPYQIQLPWDQLTEFCVRPCGVDECIEALGWMPNLVTLEVTLEPRMSLFDSRATHPHLIHPRLQSLKIIASFDVAHFYNRLTLPSLRTFEYRGESSMFLVQRSIASLISRSTSHLQEFSLANSIPLEDGYLIQVLEHTPELQMLRVEISRQCPLRSCLVQMTYRGPESHCLVPKLRNCTMRYTNDIDLVAWADMLESRWRLDDTSLGLVSRLEKVHLIDAPDEMESVDSAALGRLNKFAAEGLILTISA